MFENSLKKKRLGCNGAGDETSRKFTHFLEASFCESKQIIKLALTGIRV